MVSPNEYGSTISLLPVSGFPFTLATYVGVLENSLNDFGT